MRLISVWGLVLCSHSFESVPTIVLCSDFIMAGSKTFDFGQTEYLKKYNKACEEKNNKSKLLMN